VYACTLAGPVVIDGDVFLQSAGEQDELTGRAVGLGVGAADQRLIGVLDARVLDVLAGGRTDTLGHAVRQLTHRPVTTATLRAGPRRVQQVVCYHSSA